jgi:hypothetical protein
MRACSEALLEVVCMQPSAKSNVGCGRKQIGTRASIKDDAECRIINLSWL